MTISETKNGYVAPDVELIVATVEQGFVLSNLENPEEKDPMDW
jgi:hypothetical protein